MSASLRGIAGRSRVKYEPVVTESVAKQIAEQIRRAITNGTLKVDDKLPTEAELARQFDVSRPTIREALKRLAAKSLIRSRRGPAGGTFVKAPSTEDMSQDLMSSVALMVSLSVFDLTEIAETRHELERVCIRLAVRRRTEAELERMAAEIALQKDESLTDEEFCASDVRFHRALVDATQNAVMQFQMFTVIEALQPVENMVIFRFRERARTIEQHEKILRALRAQDLARAEEALDEQMVYLRKSFSRAQEWRRKRDTAEAVV
ncbi:MAG: FadR family transcriptional regulator [Boseongicola sp. SB0677_bin_26]|nr:FadR family transcriptional regulator [Boseongicola sp. SB0677_bin_26]